MKATAAATPIEVLLIEDDIVDEMATLRTVVAAGLPYKVKVARSLAQARSLLATQSFDVILADYQLADGTSFDLMETFADQLVIFITGAWDAAAAARALRVGVHDFMVKDAEGTYLQLLHYRVESALRQRRLARELRESEARLQAILDHAPASISAHDLAGRLILSNRHYTDRHAEAGDAPTQPGECEEDLRHPDGSEHTYLTVRFPMSDNQGRTQAMGAISVDITERKQAEERIRQLAFYDPLTGLPNRRLLLDRLRQSVAGMARHGGQAALLFIDLDRFKTLNDTLGHDHGDLLLQEVARRLLACVRAEDTVARIGGDEFVVMSGSLADDAAAAAPQAATVAQKILIAVGQPCQLGVHSHTVTPSVGVTLFHGRDGALEEIIKRADLAMYQAKAAGRGAVRFFDPQMQHTLDTRAALECQLRDAPQSGQLSLHFQSQVSDHGVPVGAELLLRWHHPQQGLLLPAQFLALAEQNGMIVPIGAWVLDRACAQLALWATHPAWRCLRLAVNISRRQFQHEGFVGLVVAALERHGAASGQLRLELREEVVQDDPAMALVRMKALTQLGVGFAVDDFGVSYSSLAHMKRLPLQQIKIARSLITRVASDPHDAAVVKTIIGIAQGMGLDAVATGVETLQQRDCLRELGCTLLQGHYFGAPMPLLAFEAGLASPFTPSRRARPRAPIIAHEPKHSESGRGGRLRPPAAGTAHPAEPGPPGLHPHDADPGRQLAAGTGRA